MSILSSEGRVRKSKKMEGREVGRNEKKRGRVNKMEGREEE